MAKEADPRSEWSALEGELAGGKLAPAYVLRGQERWFRERALEAVLELARKRALEVCRHDARDPDFRLQSLLDDLTGFAMFASARCVAIAEPEALLKKSAGGEDSALSKAVRSFVRGARGTLVLVADSLRSDLAVVKELVQAGAALKTFRKLYDRPAPWERDPDPRRTELIGWLLQRAKDRGLALATDQALLIAHSQGNDLAALDSQLEALANGGTEALARLASSAAGSPGQVADGLLAGDAASSVLAIETLFRGGMRRERDGARETDESALVSILLGYLRPRVRSGLVAAEAIERGATPQDAAGEAGIGAYDRALRESLGSRSAKQWRAMLDDLLDLERRSRRGTEIDASHLARLALRWSRRAPARAR